MGHLKVLLMSKVQPNEITVPFRSIQPGGRQGDRLDEIWTSAILRWTGYISQILAKVKVWPLVLVVACDVDLTPKLSVVLQRPWTSSDMQLKKFSQKKRLRCQYCSDVLALA